MKWKHWIIGIVIVACTAITTPPPATTDTTTELIPSTVVTIDDPTTTTTTTRITTTTTTMARSTTTVSSPVVTIAPPIVASTTLTTRPVTIPTSPPITILPEIAVVYSTAFEDILEAATNLARSSLGLPTLLSHIDLDFYARIWAAHLSRTGVLAHSDISSLLGPWAIVGENVGKGGSIEEINIALFNSATHYETMTNRAFLHTGVGVAVAEDGTLWVVQIFGGTVLP